MNKLPFTEHRKIYYRTLVRAAVTAPIAMKLSASFQLFSNLYKNSASIFFSVVFVLNHWFINESVSVEFFVYRHEIQVIQ